MARRSDTGNFLMLLVAAGAAGAFLGDWAFKTVLWLGMGVLVLGTLVYLLESLGIGGGRSPVRPSSIESLLFTRIRSPARSHGYWPRLNQGMPRRSNGSCSSRTSARSRTPNGVTGRSARSPLLRLWVTARQFASLRTGRPMRLKLGSSERRRGRAYPLLNVSAPATLAPILWAARYCPSVLGELLHAFAILVQSRR